MSVDVAGALQTNRASGCQGNTGLGVSAVSPQATQGLVVDFGDGNG